MTIDHRFVVFEGLPGSGKTTITRILSDKESFLRIPEILGGDFQEVLSDCLFKESNLFYLQSDFRKYTMAHKIIRETSLVPIMDRGYVSTLAYNYVQKESPLNFHATRKWIHENSETFIEPYSYIFLDIDVSLCNSRKKRKEDTQRTWMNDETLRKTKKYYDSFFEKISPKTKVFHVDANRSLHLVLEDVIRFLSFEFNKQIGIKI